MLTLSRELKEIKHPLVKSIHIKQDFRVSEKIQRRLVIEAGFGFGSRKRDSEDKLMDLLVDLQGLLDSVEEQTGKLDCIDICPLQQNRDIHRLAA